jgi:hypothetical protein
MTGDFTSNQVETLKAAGAGGATTSTTGPPNLSRHRVPGRIHPYL